MMKKNKQNISLAFQMYFLILNGIQYIIKETSSQFEMPKLDYFILLIVYYTPGINQHKIEKIFQLDKTTLSRALVRMENSGFIEKYKESTNRKSNLTKITEAGTKIAKNIEQSYEKYILKILKGSSLSNVNITREVIKNAYLQLDKSFFEDERIVEL